MGSKQSKNRGGLPNAGLVPEALVKKEDINRVEYNSNKKNINREIPFRNLMKIDVNQKENEVKFYDDLINPENFNEKWKYESQKPFNHNTRIFSIFGGKNSGKTTFLSRFTNTNKDISSSTKTNGLGIIFPTDMNSKNFTFVEMPALSNEFFGQKQSLENRLNLSKGYELMFDYAISISNVIFIVVNDYSFEDVQLVNRVKKKVQEDQQKIIIIHNLKDKKTKQECDDYISNLKNTLKLQRNNYVFMSNQKELQDKNTHYYKEEFSRERDDKIVDIIHIIYGNNNEESGNFFNAPAQEFCQSTIATSSSKEAEFNVVDSLNKFLDKESMRFFNKQKKFIKESDGNLKLYDTDETATKDINYACFYEEDKLFVKLELLSTKLKTTFKFERGKNTYNFNGTFTLISLENFLDAEVKEEPDQKKSVLIKINNSTHDLNTKKQTGIERKNGILTIEYDYKEKQDDDDDDD